MDFVDSFTNFKEQPRAKLVDEFYDKLHDFLKNKCESFLDLWGGGDSAVLFFNLHERERGLQAVREAFRQIRDVLSKVPAGTTLEPAQITFQESGELAFAVLMEKAVSDFSAKVVVSEHRATIVWRRFDGHWKVVHYHTDTYDRRMEAISEMLRRYERK